MKISELYIKPCFIIGVVLGVTLLCYLFSLNNDFLRTWDDHIYVTNNELIKDVSFNSIKRMFTEDDGLYGNYHPLTILSLALNYHDGVGSFPFHLTNLILHLLNTALVFIFIYLISEKIVVAGLVSLWFGIHPVHVESVAWISERKDVLYAFFYLLSLITYRLYLKKNLNITWYILTLVFFVCSVLSKSMAVSLSVVLFAIDYLASRKFQLRVILEKIPFVLFAIIVGLVAVKLQGESATGGITFPFVNKVLHGFYGFSMYIAKMFIPANLSAFYPYPYPLVNNQWVGSSIPSVLFVTLFTSIGVMVSVVYLYVKRSPLAKHLVFGLGFYVASVIPIFHISDCST
jgi:hypothetical protein